MRMQIPEVTQAWYAGGAMVAICPKVVEWVEKKLCRARMLTAELAILDPRTGGAEG